MRKLPLADRKRILRDIVPKESRCFLFAKHIPQRGRDLFAAVCERDLEGIVAKWKHAPYNPAALPLSWLKVKNPQYTKHGIGTSFSSGGSPRPGDTRLRAIS